MVKFIKSMAYDLEQRTLSFAKRILAFVNSVPFNPVTSPLVNQLTKSGTSVGANYHEANEAESKRDFVHKIAIANKEAKETRYWLKLFSHSKIGDSSVIKQLAQEAKELNFIFSSILKTCKQKKSTV